MLSRWLAALFALTCSAQAGEVLLVRIDSVIHPITVEIVRDGIAQAQAHHAQALVLELSTPGGLLDATRESISEILKAPMPVITFVTPTLRSMIEREARWTEEDLRRLKLLP